MSPNARAKLTEALAANWANIATLVVGVVICFSAFYMRFLRSEIHVQGLALVRTIEEIDGWTIHRSHKGAQGPVRAPPPLNSINSLCARGGVSFRVSRKN